MSHFTVLVIGENPEAQLAPWNENAPELGSKWDWYQLGGRWRGAFKLKDKTLTSEWVDCGEPGTGGNEAIYDVDSANKDDIDFEYMRDVAAINAGTQWDDVHAALDGRGIPAPWPRFLEAFRAAGGNLDEARISYQALPAVLVTQSIIGFGDDIADYDCTREEYCVRRRRSAFTTFAVLRDGKWYERGEMGWWANVTGNKGDDAWNAEFEKLLADLPGDTRLSVYDCHI